MKIRNYITEIRAEVNGTIQVFSGPMVPGTSFEEAQKYCEENGLGYCTVIGVEDEVTELKREISVLQERIKDLETMESYHKIIERVGKKYTDPLIQPYKGGDIWYGTSTKLEGNGLRQGFKSKDNPYLRSPNPIETPIGLGHLVDKIKASDEIASEKEASQEKFFKELWEE